MTNTTTLFPDRIRPSLRAGGRPDPGRSRLGRELPLSLPGPTPVGGVGVLHGREGGRDFGRGEQDAGPG